MNTQQHQIVEAFERHVIRCGYAGTNLDDIARELKISKKTMYVHFDDKRDIYAHVVERQARREKARLSASVASLGSFADRVEAVVRSVLSMARSHVLETSEEEWLHEYEVAADAFRKATGDLLRELVQDGMDAGEFRPGDALLVEKMVAAMIVEYLLLVNGDPTFDRDEELAQRIGRFIN